MKKYNVLIEETVVQTFTVQAASEDDALLVAEQKYKAGEFVLEPGNLTNVQYFIENLDSVETIV